MAEELAATGIQVFFEADSIGKLAAAGVQVFFQSGEDQSTLAVPALQIFFEADPYVAEAAVDALAGLPEQFYLIHDALAAGSSVIYRADSEFGPRNGVPAPDSGNQGSLVPSVLGEPDDNTEPNLTFQLTRGALQDGPGWIYKANDTWYGYNGYFYLWGFHPVKGSGVNKGGIVLYSSVFNRILVLTVNGGPPGSGNIETRYIDRDERPQTNPDWTQPSNWEPVNGVHEYDDQPIAGCEMRDGSLILVVRQIGSRPTVSNALVDRGDYDVYRSTDGGLTWEITAENIVQNLRGVDDDVAGGEVQGRAMIRLASSGDWLRFCWVETSPTGSPAPPLIRTIGSSDGGITWSFIEGPDGTAGDSYIGDVEDFLTNRARDEAPYDLVGIDDTTGTFLLVYEKTSAGGLGYQASSRNNAWESVGDQGSIVGVRSIALVRTPDQIWIFVVQYPIGDPVNNRMIWGYVPRNQALDENAWDYSTTSYETNEAVLFRPLQLSAAWCEDRIALCFYLENKEVVAPTYVGAAARPYIAWGGGWSGYPIASNNIFTLQPKSVVTWWYIHGQPAGGSASIAGSDWTMTTSAGGTSSWSAQGLLVEDRAHFEIPIDVEPPYAWDPDYSVERWHQDERHHVIEWVFAAGQTFASTGDHMGILRLWAPSHVLQGGAGWQLLVGVTADEMVCYADQSATPLLTLNNVDIAGSLEEDRYLRGRICIFPATTTPHITMMLRREDGGDWRTTDPVEITPDASGVTTTNYAFGQIVGYSDWSLPSSDAVTRWREFTAWSTNLRRSFADPNFEVFRDLAGAPTSLLPIGIGAGITQVNIADLKVAWSGGSGSVGDKWTWELEHSHPAEHMFLDSPQYPYLSAAGATAGTAIVLDAEGTSGYSNRWLHGAAAMFDTGGAETIKIEYANNAAFSVAATSFDVNLVQHADLRVNATIGNSVRIDASSAAASQINEGALNGRYLKVTAETGAGRIGHVHRIQRHRYDGSYHYLELSDLGQFDPDVITAGDSVSIISDRAFKLYDATFGRRFMRISFGATGQNSWDGRWKLGRLVLGIARKFDPPMTWAHTDTQTPDVVLNQSRGGASWAYEQSPPSRRWVARWIGDDSGARRGLRENLAHLAAYQEQPIALLVEKDHLLGEEGDLLLTRFDGSAGLDEQAWKEFPSEGNFRRPVGDMQLFFREIV